MSFSVCSFECKPGTNACYLQCSHNGSTTHPLCPDQLTCEADDLCYSPIGEQCAENQDCGDLEMLYCNHGNGNGSCHYIDKVDSPCRYPNCGKCKGHTEIPGPSGSFLSLLWQRWQARRPDYSFISVDGSNDPHKSLLKFIWCIIVIMTKGTRPVKPYE